jgi:ubiquinone/menaquinone biosynthesis C-methylase UbiE
MTEHQHPTSVRAFGAEHAKRYDESAELLMGDRPRQRLYLIDLLRCLPEEPRTFVELACGTGYFTEVFFEAFPGVRGIAFDGSEAMLEQARERFSAGDRQLEFRCELLQTMDWSLIQATSLVFSAFALHHLSHDEKESLFRRIFEHLEPSGHFILFDSFRPDDPKADEIVERLTCLDIERRVRDARGSAPPLESIIARDRESKAAEGDRETAFETDMSWLRDVGFEGVTGVFLDARMGGIVAIKPGRN